MSSITDWFSRFSRHSQPVKVATPSVDAIARETHLRLLSKADDVADADPRFVLSLASNVSSELSHKPPDVPLDQVGETTGEKYEALRAAVDTLPRRQRELLLLHVNEGLTYKQIAERQGLSNKAVLSELKKAYATLRMRTGRA